MDSQGLKNWKFVHPLCQGRARKNTFLSQHEKCPNGIFHQPKNIVQKHFRDTKMLLSLLTCSQTKRESSVIGSIKSAKEQKIPQLHTTGQPMATV